MTITIYESNDKHSVMLGSKDKRFAEAWGSVYKVSTANIYADLAAITAWANNELNEACLFEID